MREVLRDDPEAAWVEAHLRTLVGLASQNGSWHDRRSEAFFAWRRFLEALAGARPLVLVFEDLHWADDDLLDFIDHVLEWASDAPLLILCTARPELLERRPGWGASRQSSLLLRLAALRDEDVEQIVSALLGSSILLPETRRPCSSGPVGILSMPSSTRASSSNAGRSRRCSPSRCKG